MLASRARGGSRGFQVQIPQGNLVTYQNYPLFPHREHETHHVSCLLSLHRMQPLRAYHALAY